MTVWVSDWLNCQVECGLGTGTRTGTGTGTGTESESGTGTASVVPVQPALPNDRARHPAMLVVSVTTELPAKVWVRDWDQDWDWDRDQDWD